MTQSGRRCSAKPFLKPLPSVAVDTVGAPPEPPGDSLAAPQDNFLLEHELELEEESSDQILAFEKDSEGWFGGMGGCGPRGAHVVIQG